MIKSQVFVYVFLVIVTSTIVSYLGERSSAAAENGVEGFQGTDENIEALNDEMSEKVTNLDDSLHVTKYKKDYENTLVYGHDYFNAMKVSSLFDFSSIVKNQNDKEKTVQSCIELAKKLSALHEGAAALRNTQL